MILTCPACSTKYVVKEGAIPPGGRQVRCASCKHSWHQDPEGAAAGAAEPVGDAPAIDAPLAEAPTESLPPADTDAAVADAHDVAAAPPDDVGEAEPAAPPERDQWQETAPAPAAPAAEPARDWPAGTEPAEADEFEPFYEPDPVEPERRGLRWLVWLLLAVAVIAAAAWFLAPAELRQRLGLADIGDTPLEVMVTTSDRQKLASGNEIFSVSGRVINPTDRDQAVPPLRAELLDASRQRVVYSWTIDAPAPTLAPGTSASFHSGEMGVPEGGSHLRVTLGEPSA